MAVASQCLLNLTLPRAHPRHVLRSIGQADVTANVYVRFDFVYDK